MQKTSHQQMPLLKNAGTAPVVYFDGVPVFGTFNGMVELELVMRMMSPKPDGSVQVDMNCVAHLRCTVLAAEQLMDVLERVLQRHTQITAIPNH